MECYKDLSYLYDELIYDDIDYKEISDYIMEKYHEYGNGNLLYLDLACGTANVSTYVGKNFKETFLVDFSEDMLMEASTKMLKEKIRFKILLQDMTELNLNRKFDLITCVLDSTNYILDDEGVKNYFQGVYDHLNDGGVFIFDINTSYKIKEVLGNNTFTYNTEEIFYSWENSLENDIVEMDLTFFVKEDSHYKKFEEFHRERAYKEDEIEAILSNIGFKMLEKQDGYRNKQILEDTERIVYIVNK